MNIYEITEELRAIYEEIEMADGELTDEVAAKLEIAQGQLQDKAESYCALIRNVSAEAEALKDEADRLTKRRRSLENLQTRLKEALRCAMIVSDTAKMDAGIFKLSLRKSEAVDITDEAAVPDMFCEFKRTVSKSAIKDFIKGGGEVKGAQIIENINLMLK